MRAGAKGAMAAAFALLGAAAPLAAQTANIAPPPEKFAVAPGGVDMRSGRYAYSQTDLAIGGEAGLSLTRTLAQPVAGHHNPFGNFSHDWDILLSEKRINVQQNIFNHSPGQPDYQLEVTFGGLSQTFRAEGPVSGPTQVSRSGFAQLTVAGTKVSASAVYTFRAGDGTEAVFRPIGSNDCSSQLRCAYVSHIVRADGTRLDFQYDNQGANATRLRSVTSSRGYALVLEYGGTLIVKACVLNLALAPRPDNNVCPAGAQASATYSYTTAAGTGAPLLASATDPAGATWGFTYAGPQMGFVRPGETSPWLVNSTSERMNDDGLIEVIVASQAFADGSSYTYLFGESPLVVGHISQLAGGSYADALGNVTSLEYGFPTLPYDPGQGHGNVPEDGGFSTVTSLQTTPGPERVTDPLGRVTAYDYCDPFAMQNAPRNWRHRCFVMPMPVSVTDPEGIRTEYLWDMVLRVVLQSRQYASDDPNRLNPITRSATYHCTPAEFRACTRPVTATDARGAVTNYSYAPEHGGLLTETLPAPTAGAARPQTRHHYDQRRAWLSNGGGGYVPAAPPVWVRFATSQCRTSAATGVPTAPCATAGDEMLTVYDYGPDSGPNNLLLRGQAVVSTDNGQVTTLRTCYAYDPLGRRIAETQPNAHMGSCP